MKAVLIVLFVFLFETCLSHRQSRTKWQNKVTPCTASKTACIAACGIKLLPGHTDYSCDPGSGYCICPPSCRHKENCRSPSGKNEMRNCNTFECGYLNPDQATHHTQKASHDGSKMSLNETIVLLQEEGERQISTAMVCVNIHRLTLHCACFQHTTKGRKVQIVKEKASKRQKTELVDSNRFGNGK